MNKLDIIVPVRNEAKNIHNLVKRIVMSLKPLKIKYKILFIDDRSTDTTIEVLKVLKKVYPIKIYHKKGKLGKAYSILEGVRYSDAEYIVMIDADCQYPPEAIPAMLEKTKNYDVVITNRKKYKASFTRKIISKGFNAVFAKLLHGFNFDVQSGLKLFKREIALHISPHEVTPWTLDLTLLHTAKDLGYKIGEVEIDFDKRIFGKSKVDLYKTSFEIGKAAVKTKFIRRRIFSFKPESGMKGSGLFHKGKKYVTHTTLPYTESAMQTFLPWQIGLIVLVIEIFIFGLLINPLNTVITVVAILSIIYFLDVLFNLWVVLKSMHNPPEIRIEGPQINKIEEQKLPIYTILCPLYREAKVIPTFINSIKKLDWPKEKLDVILLLEEDDSDSIQEVKSLKLPSYITYQVVPHSFPKTKPKACNYGLHFAKGKYLVVYDAEDIPEPLQLKKAYLAFANMPTNYVCLQAKLNYFNSSQNLLTRFFTAEYSLWFDVILTGLQSIQTAIPLGGTSNHFKTEILRSLEGWDPFNVTEDCDLGARLYKRGFKTAIIESTTLEEANSQWGNWLRQRSRWIKGYMQTYLIHTRDPYSLVKSYGYHALIFQLIIGSRISFMLINPILWVTTIAYFTLYPIVGPTIESIYPSLVFYMAAFSLVFGNFMYIYNYMIGVAKKEQWDLMKYIFIIPFYWLMTSVAASIAFYQLLVKPHYWEKTTHGLHIKRVNFKVAKEGNIFIKPFLIPGKIISSFL